MRNLLLIAKREYLEQIRGKAFKVSTVLVPVMFLIIAGIIFLAGRNTAVGKHLAVAAPTTQLANDIRGKILEEKELQTTVLVIAPAKPEDRDDLKQKLLTQSIDGYLWVDQSSTGEVTATYTSQSSGDITITAVLKSALNDALVNERLMNRGMKQADVDAALKSISVDTMQVGKDGKVTKSSGWVAFFKGYFMALLLAMTTMIYGMNVARSIIQEKTSRIFEVMLSAVKASDLLAGKLIGVGAVGLTQIAIWGVAVSILAGTTLAASLMTQKIDLHITWQEGVLFTVYFLLGYLLYSSLFSGLAATCETEQELQMYTPLAAIPIWLGFGMIALVINNPNSALAIAASLFPATAPIVMILRMGSEMPPAWQFAASIGIMILSILGILWVSTRLYRVGILMYGKRATLPEIVRWIRYS